MPILTDALTTAESKPVLTSRTAWTAVLGFLVSLANTHFQWLAISPTETAGIMGFLMLVLRLVSKGKVTLT